LQLDPRVKTPAVGLTQIASLTREGYRGAVAAQTDYTQARALAAELEKLSGPEVDAFKAQVDSLAPPPGRGGRGFFRRRAAGPPSLQTARDDLLDAAMAMQSAELTPTAGQVAACERARTQAARVTARWTALKTTGLAAFNAKRKAAGQPAISLPSPKP
jgi:hypothetical protein